MRGIEKWVCERRASYVARATWYPRPYVLFADLISLPHWCVHDVTLQIHAPL